MRGVCIAGGHYPAVDHFTVPDGSRREDSPERSFMYSLRVYVVPLEEEDGNHKYVFLMDPTCHHNKTTVPCKKGDLSIVNTHHKSRKRCICALYVGYVQNHTRGIYQGITLQRTSVSCVRHSYPYPELLYVLYARGHNTRGTGAAIIYLPGTYVSSVRPSPVAQYPGYAYSIFLPARNFCEFCKTFMFVPGTSVSSA